MSICIAGRYSARVHRLLIFACLAACGAPPAPRPAPPPTPVARPTALVFSPSGDRVIVDERWIVHTDRPQIERIAAGEGQPIFAADGRIAWLAPGALTIGGTRTPLPVMQQPPVADLELRGLWLDLDRLYLHEWHPVKGTAACRIFDRRSAGLTRPAQCLSIARPIRLQAGPADLLAVVEVAAAGPILRLARYTPSGGTTELIRFDLRPDGRIALAFDPDGGRVRLTSDCDLTRPNPCAAPHRLNRPWLFEYDLLEAALIRADALPPGAAPGPGTQVAWPILGGVCTAPHPRASGRCRTFVSTPGASGYTPPHVGDDHP